MLVGVQYQGGEGDAKAFARRAEAGGFDSVFCGDHVGHLYDGVAMLGVFAGATTSITIGLNLLVTPYRSAAVAAKALATIAQVAPGRVVAGFGVGGEFPGEFTATGADIRRRGAATDEALAVISELWTGEPVTYHGRFTTLDAFQLTPAPAPPPPMWIGGRSEAALRRAIRFGMAYSPYLVSPQQLATRRQRLHELAEEAGRSLDGFTVACLVTVIPGVSIDAAIDRGFGALQLSGVSRETIRAHYLLGGDDALVERLDAYRQAGVDHLILGCLPGSVGELDEFFAKAELLRSAAQH